LSVVVHYIPDSEKHDSSVYRFDRAGRPWLNEKIFNQDHLLITIGDSWTWGDSLGAISREHGIHDDFEYRTNHIYGNLLRESLDCDWLNLAFPGCANSWIIDKVRATLDIADQLKYQKITVVCTLTELCRNIILNPPTTIPSTNTLNELLQWYEANDFQQLKQLIDQADNRFDFIVGRNFTDTFKENYNILGQYLVNETWCDVLQKQFKFDPYTNTKMVSGIGIEPLIKYLEKQNLRVTWQQELNELLDLAQTRTDFLSASPFNSKYATRHPNEQGHQIWANHLLKYIDI
jgi:hypothetical protein